MGTIDDNLQSVEERIARSLARCGRNRDEIRVIAVTKTFPAEVTRDAYEAGLREFGENYVQEFESKMPHLAGLDGARFHMIGHLQSNKVNKAAPLFDCVQTVDSVRLAQRLSAFGKPMDIMLEVKLSEEESKHGCAPEELSELLEIIADLPNLSILGLMTMPPFFDDPEQSRPYFAKLKALADRSKLRCLSMGMSNDFEAAIEEGATHIRLGTVLFGKRTKRA